MKLILNTHPGVELIDPKISLVSTLDEPAKETFTPTILFVVEPNIQISHVMPEQPYVKGTWSDTDVESAIAKYIDEIKID